MDILSRVIAVTSVFLATSALAQEPNYFDMQMEMVNQNFPDAKKQIDRFVCLRPSERPEDQLRFNKGLRAEFHTPDQQVYFYNLEEALLEAETLPIWPSFPTTIEEARVFLQVEEFYKAVEAIKFPVDQEHNFLCNKNLS